MALFRLPLEYQEKLKKKIGDLAVRTQIQICTEADEDYQKKKSMYADKTPINESLTDKSDWASVSRDKFVALLDEREYRMQGYAEWYFEDDVDNAWRNSDSPSEPSESYWDNEDWYEGCPECADSESIDCIP